jgi:hypothetical protein
MGANEFSQAKEKISLGTSADFKIKKVEVIKNDTNGDDFLVITAEHGNGCGGEFNVIWDGVLRETTVAPVNIFVQFIDHCEPGDITTFELRWTLLKINLNLLSSDPDFADKATFNILSGISND